MHNQPRNVETNEASPEKNIARSRVKVEGKFFNQLACSAFIAHLPAVYATTLARIM
jgi:hypothetical protein